MRILRHPARHTQREPERHDAADHVGDPALTDRREYLARAATRTGAASLTPSNDATDDRTLIAIPNDRPARLVR